MQLSQKKAEIISSRISRADHALYQAKTNGRNQYQIALNEEQIVDLT